MFHVAQVVEWRSVLALQKWYDTQTLVLARPRDSLSAISPNISAQPLMRQNNAELTNRQNKDGIWETDQTNHW